MLLKPISFMKVTSGGGGGTSYFTTNAGTPTYFVDTANLGSGVTRLEWHAKMRFNSAPDNDAAISSQESLGFDFQFQVGASGTLEVTVEDASGSNKKLLNEQVNDSGASAVVLSTSTWYELEWYFDFTQGTDGQFQLTVDSTAHPVIDAANTAGTQEFVNNRELSFMGNSAGGRLLPGGTDVEYVRVYKNGSGTPYWELAGSDGAAAINADSWKQGGDVTVTSS